MVNTDTVKGVPRRFREGLSEPTSMTGECVPGTLHAGETTPRIVPTAEGHRILVEVDLLPSGGWTPHVLIELKDLDARGRAFRRLPSGGVCFRTREEALDAGERAGRVYAAELHRQCTGAVRADA